ncbi:hypothetical protein BDY19DRAFT_988095 [Irpex rosettiformis]|uniref:Uncharacterized protein n=1 Tax=Irpex rosettiformis TaxID=378272 RepID=A0ACB8UIM9_9APHY|nr:hypothetical protein BDY19DRAFT_988095 [Irpex rosettiformis]
MQWQQVTFSSADRLYSFLAILKSTLKGFPSPVDLINFVTVEAINAPSQPWIHLIPLYLNRPLFHYRKPQFALTITLRSDYLPSFLGDHVYMSRTHTAIPKSLSYFNFQCQRLELTGIKFHTLANFLLFVRAFRQLEYLHCINIGWTNDPTPDSRLQLFKAYPYPPLKRCSLQPFRHTGYEAPDTPELYWVSALWSWIRRRSVEDRRYLLEDHETQVVMNITSLFQGFWRRKYIPNLEMTIRERQKRDSHDKPLAGEDVDQLVDGFDVCFDIDRRSYSFVFTLTADSFLTVPSGAFVRPRDHYYALHLEHIAIVATTAGYSQPGLDILFDHAKFWEQVASLELPGFRHIVVGFALEIEGEFLRKTLEESNAPRNFLDAEQGKLVIAQSNQTLPGPGCRWTRLDPTTFEATGE